MPRGFHNWNASLVIKFLKRNDFTHTHTRGSHFYYVASIEGKDYQVCVPVHGSDSVHPKTMKSIMLQSGIPESKWKQ